MENINVLIVDDLPETRKIVRNILKTIGVRRIYECKDGVQALAIINGGVDPAAPPHIDVVLCDINMPRMDGIIFLREMRKHEKFSKTAVIMMSGDGTEDKIIRSVESGADAFIVKPYSLNTIEDKIIMALKKRGISDWRRPAVPRN